MSDLSIQEIRKGGKCPNCGRFSIEQFTTTVCALCEKERDDFEQSASFALMTARQELRHARERIPTELDSIALLELSDGIREAKEELKAIVLGLLAPRRTLSPRAGAFLMSKLKEAGTCPNCYRVSQEYFEDRICPNCEAFDEQQNEEGTE